MASQLVPVWLGKGSAPNGPGGPSDEICQDPSVPIFHRPLRFITHHPTSTTRKGRHNAMLPLLSERRLSHRIVCCIHTGKAVLPVSLPKLAGWLLTTPNGGRFPVRIPTRVIGSSHEAKPSRHSTAGLPRLRAGRLWPHLQIVCQHSSPCGKREKAGLASVCHNAAPRSFALCSSFVQQSWPPLPPWSILDTVSSIFSLKI